MRHTKKLPLHATSFRVLYLSACHSDSSLTVAGPVQIPQRLMKIACVAVQTRSNTNHNLAGRSLRTPAPYQDAPRNILCWHTQVAALAAHLRPMCVAGRARHHARCTRRSLRPPAPCGVACSWFVVYFAGAHAPVRLFAVKPCVSKALVARLLRTTSLNGARSG
jgi:hypothetical protein